MLAEGGTYRGHSMTTFESDNLWGPYKASTCNPIVTHRHLGHTTPISSIGHADIVQTQKGDWWMVSLGRRHLNGRVYLSRETFLSPMNIYTKHTPYGEVLFTVNEGHGRVPEVSKRPDLPWTPYAKASIRDNFDNAKLDGEWNFLRKNGTDWYELKDDQLRLDLRPEIATNLVNPSLVAKRISHHIFRASTRMTFKTKHDNEQAGLILYRCSEGYMMAMKDNESIVITSVTKGHKVEEICRVPCRVDEVILAMESDGVNVHFEWAEPNKPFQKIDAEIPLFIISDDHNGGFNGPMIGVYATSNGEKSRNSATFDWFDYSNK